ncbi:MAG TPA: hypothetical protein PLK99_00770 [Burkholderiales bacterium]|nr:hypothetical protein [Burkholderiales bacterium]
MNMFDLARLHAMIGRKVALRGARGTVMEILEDGPALVVQTDTLSIQADSLGYARRKAAETVVVPVFGPEGAYSEDFLEILEA